MARRSLLTQLDVTALSNNPAPLRARRTSFSDSRLRSGLMRMGVDRTWGSCGAFSVCDGQPTIENCGPCDGYSVSPFGRPTHPPALSHAGIGNVIN